MILLDTNVVSMLMKLLGRDRVSAWADGFATRDLYVSAITRAEIELGLSLMPTGKRKQERSRVARSVFQQFDKRCLPFDDAAAMRYVDLIASRRRAGRPISTEDAQIASIAVLHKMKLATRNTRVFESIKGLELVNPWGD